MQAERDFLRSFDRCVAQYRASLDQLRQHRLKLANYNLDTGELTSPGKYELADQTYVHLLDQLAKNGAGATSAELRKNVVSFFSQADRSKWKPQTLRELDELKAVP